MNYLQLGLLLGLGAILLLAALFPHRIARPRKTPDPFVGLEHDWQEIMQVPSKPARSYSVSDRDMAVHSFSSAQRAA